MAFQINSPELLDRLDRETARQSDLRTSFENLVLEERLPLEREQSYLDFVPPDVSDSWGSQHQEYLAEKVQLANTSSTPPECFLYPASPSPVTKELIKNQHLARLESLEPLHRRGGYRGSLNDLVQFFEDYLKDRNDPVKTERMMALFDSWNLELDARPVFCTFWGALQDDLEQEDWADRLRDRLGLAHYSPGILNRSIPVALFSYPLRTVLDEHSVGVLAALTPPTSLDSKISNSGFFPAPAENIGRTLNLGDNGGMQAELLHRKISFKPSFLRQVGWIKRESLRTVETARQDYLNRFGDEMKHIEDLRRRQLGQ